MFGWLRSGLPLSFFVVAILFGGEASAQVGSDRYASFVMDVASGQPLEADAADEPRYPASLTKMMTIYMLFEALRDRRVTLDQPVPVSAHAASMPPSKLGLLPTTYITVEQALLGLVTKSANDAASALGELLGGDEDRFAQMMTLRARALGMSHTTFRNASGLPDPDQTTTARDLAILARHLIQDYPAEYHYFSVPSFVFHGRLIPNHDRMLQTYPGADGLKTGYIDASGCNLVTSAVRGDVRLIGVVMGASNGYERDTQMTGLLDAGFDRMGVPVTREPQHWRVPTLVAAASAATLPPSTLPNPRVHYAGARGFVTMRAPAHVVVVERREEYAPRRASELRFAPAVARPRGHAEPAAPRAYAHPSVYKRAALASVHGHG